MNPTMQAVTRSARDLLKAYLALYPGEALRLIQLHEQLEQGNANVLLRSTMLGHITTSMVVFDPVTRKVLLIAHGIYKDWMPAGGHYELDLSMWLSAAREVLEETGVVVVQMNWHGADSAGLPIDIDTHPIPANEKKGEGDHFHHDFTFVATASSDVPLVPQLDEVNAVDWVFVEELRNSPLERVRRLGAKLEAAFPATAGN
ncbi:hypothetical protein WJ97_12825 [Burkholderia ubonensis]|uniref:NUDIX hydrolase n=1 Tax=Burkholderia ubonensis TaxID=101571 RepID=UPI000753FC44|nr:NUDIX domain-containing protein [Burkholderia ubonensis]KVP96757.1 hypothetical protein WJ97_12825 [Burkholderia ubonensis]